MDNGEDKKIEQDPHKHQYKNKKINEQNVFFTDFNNVVNDVCQVLSDMFKSNIIRTPKRPFQHEDEYRYNPNTWNYSTSTIYKNKNK
jgi:serine/threonine protein kinase HipA of HipAB toxin-antitoxin module